jgi:hypothetical protein
VHFNRFTRAPQRRFIRADPLLAWAPPAQTCIRRHRPRQHAIPLGACCPAPHRPRLTELTLLTLSTGLRWR